MSEHRDTAANRLDHVIMIIQLGRQTGTLSVERGADKTFEEGWISFIHGQITWARARQQDNEAALNWLKTWGPCRFAFTASEVTWPMPPQQLSPASRTKGTSHEVTWSASEGMQSRLVEGMHVKNEEEELANGHTHLVSIPYRTVQLEEGLMVINCLSLPRSHRRIFLLIDEHRTTTELACLFGRRLDELQRILSDLEKAGIIHQQQVKPFSKGW